jgi:hypothetical protein
MQSRSPFALPGEFRTLVLQVLLQHGVLAPSFLVSAAHDADAVAQTVDAMAAVAAAYRQALQRGIGGALRGRPVRPLSGHGGDGLSALAVYRGPTSAHGPWAPLQIGVAGKSATRRGRRIVAWNT